MIDLVHRRLIPLLLSCLIVVVARPAKAQDDEPEEDAAPVVQQFMWNEENFDQWIFGGMGNAGSNRNRFASLLALQIADVERSCSLSPVQKKKLELAGRGDVKRFFESVEEKRRKFRLAMHDQNKAGLIFQEIQPLQTAVNSGLFGDDSLYHKTIESTLDASQAASYRKSQHERKVFHYRAKIEQVVSQLDASVGFRVEQRRRLVALIVENTEPPKKFGQYDYYVVLYSLSQIPEAKLKPIFDDVQWRVMSRTIAQGKGMEQFLKNQGFAPAAVVIPAKPIQDAAKPDQAKTK